MHEQLQFWIGQRLQRPGIHAFGIRLADKTSFSHSFVPEFSPAQLDATWETICDTLSGLHLHRVQAHRLTWRFAQGDVYFAIRSDGITLGLITHLPSPDIAEHDLDGIIDEFLALQATAPQ